MNARFTLPFFILFLVCSSLRGQLHFNWSQSFGGLNSDFAGRLLADEDDNLYFVSTFRDTVDVDPGPDVQLVFPTSSNVITLTKSDPEGNLLWLAQFHTGGAIAGHLLDVQPDHLYMSMRFTDSLHVAVDGQTLLTYSNAGQHICILKISLHGELLDAEYIALPYSAGINTLVTLNTGHTLINGSFTDTFFFPGAPVLISNGKLDQFFVLRDPSGNVEWIRSFGSEQNDYITRVIPFADTRFHFSMTHYDTLVLPTVNGDVVFPAAVNDNSLLVTLNLSGEVEQAFPLANDLDNAVEDLAVDQDENIYIVGYFDGDINFAHPLQPPVLYSATNLTYGFVAKYTADGYLDWVNVYTSTNYSFMTLIAIARGNEIYISGGTTGKTDLDPGPDSLFVYADDRSDLLLGKLDPEGNQTYMYYAGATGVEGITSLVISTARSEVIVSGFYSDSLDCDFSDDEYWISPVGEDDVFRIAFTEENVTSTSSTSNKVFHSSVYPNPVTDYLHVESDLPIDFISIQSMNGQPVRKVAIHGLHTESLDVSDLVPGLYVVILQAGDQVAAKKIVKVKA